MVLTENCYVVEQLLVHTISESCIEGFIILIMWFDSRYASGFSGGSLIDLVYINDIADDIIGFGRFLADYTSIGHFALDEASLK